MVITVGVSLRLCLLSLWAEQEKPLGTNFHQENSMLVIWYLTQIVRQSLTCLDHEFMVGPLNAE